MASENNIQFAYPPQMMHQQTDEISLAELFSSVWDGKWLIASVTVICIFLGCLYGFNQPTTAQIFLTLKEINDADFLGYEQLNSVKEKEKEKEKEKIFFEITRESLLTLFTEEVNDTAKWVAAVTKHNLLNKSDFKTDGSYKKELIKLSNAFEILPPSPADEKIKNRKQYWSIEYDGQFTEKEIDVIEDVLKKSTEAVRAFFQKKFENTKKHYSKNLLFDLEELNDGIANQIAIYDQKTRNHLEFLNEQAQIARTLGIQKNTIEAQTFKSTNTVVANVKSDNSFYLRGYEAIEKEIELLKSRSVKEAHIPELIDLYNKRRILEQDKTIARVQVAFDATPIVLGDFKAAEYDLRSADIESKNKTKLIVALSVVLGAMLGLFVLLVRNAIVKVSIKKN